jgi:hypothetical protein
MGYVGRGWVVENSETSGLDGGRWILDTGSRGFLCAEIIMLG